MRHKLTQHWALYRLNYYRPTVSVRTTHRHPGPVVSFTNDRELLALSLSTRRYFIILASVPYSACIQWKTNESFYYPNVTTLCSSICCRKSICLSSVTFVHPTQPVKFFGYDFTPFCTLAIRWHPCNFFRISSQGNRSVRAKNTRR